MSVEESSTVGARRRPWLAAVLGVAALGLGHLYAGRPYRGLLAHALVLLASLTTAWAIVSARGPLSIVAPLAGLLLVWILLVRDGAACAHAAGYGYQRQPYNRWWVYGLVFLSAQIVGTVAADHVRNDWVQAFKFPSSSMDPTLRVGDHLLVDKRAYRASDPQRGDIVVFQNSNTQDKPWLKRIIGLPGETVEVRDKHIFIDGSAISDPSAHFTDEGPAKKTRRDMMAPVTLAENDFFVVGDNRDRSYDSRFWGAVPRHDIFGKASVVYFSWDPDAGTVRWNRIGMPIE